MYILKIYIIFVFMKTIEQIKTDLLDYITYDGILRKLMSKNEIKAANQLAKEGLIIKGISDDKQKSIIFIK